MVYHKNCWIYFRHSTEIIQFTEMRMNWTIRSKSDLRIILFPHRLFIQMNYKMKIAIYILHTFSWRIIWMQSGPALSRCEIGLNVFKCVSNSCTRIRFTSFSKKRNHRHSHHFEYHIWDAYAYTILAIWLFEWPCWKMNEYCINNKKSFEPKTL